MRKKLNEKRLADRLDAYIDLTPDTEGGEGKPPGDPVVDALRLSAASLEPAPEFVERFSTTLRQRRITRSPSPCPRVPLSPRLIWAGAAVAVALLLAFVLLPLFGGDQDLPPLPRLVYASDSDLDLLTCAVLTLTTDLPAAPAEVAVYHATINPLPTTPEEALAWARDFGLLDPQVYRNPRAPEEIVVLGDDGQQLTFYWGVSPRNSNLPVDADDADVNDGPPLHVEYRNDAAARVDGPPLSFDQATEAAVVFLHEHDSLPATYQVEGQCLHSRCGVYVVPELDGRPLQEDTAGLYVFVNPAGQVDFAYLTLITFEQGDAYPIKSAREAYEELTSDQRFGSAFRLDIHHITMPDAEVQYYYPDPPTYAIGDPVTATGQVQVLLAEDGSEVRAQLTTGDRIRYDLLDLSIPSMITMTRQNDCVYGREWFHSVRIYGTVVAQAGPCHWRVDVADWETIPTYRCWWREDGEDTGEYFFPRPLGCLVGAITLDGDDAWLTTDEGERYRLPNVPDELADGVRVEACAYERPAEGGDLDWHRIVSPDQSHIMHVFALDDWSPKSSEVQGSFLIDHVELVYYDEQFISLDGKHVPVVSSPQAARIIQPVWVFHGHNADNTRRVTAYIQAVTDEYVEKTEATVMPAESDD